MIVEIIVDIRTAIASRNRSGVRSFQEFLTGIICILCSLFQHQNIRNDLGTGISLEGGIRKTDSTQQVSVLHDVAAHSAVTAVHGVAGCDKHHDTAGSDLIQRLCKEIVVNRAGDLLRILLVRNGIVTKRHITDGHIHEVVGNISLLKALDAHIGIGIEVLGDQASNAVQLHHGPATDLGCHIRRHSTHEVTNAGRRLHHSAAGKAKLTEAVIHSLDHGNIRIMCIQGRASCASVFFLGQQFFQLLEFLGPVRFPLIKSIRKAAPSHILGKNHLFRLSRIPSLGFQFLHQVNGFHIGLVPGLFTIRQIQTVPNHKVTPFGLLGRLLGDLLDYFLMELFSLFARDICVLSRFFSYSVSSP